jgi:hypothetical protein
VWFLRFLELWALFSNQKAMLDLLEGWLRHKSDMVNFEAARAICETKGVSSAQLARSIAGWCKFVHICALM